MTEQGCILGRAAGKTICPTLATDRLYMRAAEYRDAHGLTKILKDPDVSGKIAIFTQPYKHEESIKLCRLSGENPSGMNGWFMSIFLRSTMEQIGSILLAFDREGEEGFLMDRRMDDLATLPPPKSAELGCWFGKSYWGKGYASEALVAVVDAGFSWLKLEYIHASADTYNTASKSMLLKNGFDQDSTVFLRPTATGKARPSNNFRLSFRQWTDQVTGAESL